MLYIVGIIILLTTWSSQFHPSAHALPRATPPTQNIAIPLQINISANNPINSNCHGSLWCTLYSGQFVQTAYRIATKGFPDPPPSPFWNPGPMNDTAFYAENSHAICIPILGTISQGGFCVFAQTPIKQGEQPGVTGKMIKWSLRQLVESGCRMCGSVGNDDWGWITANYVTGPVFGGVCPEATYKDVKPGALL